MASGVSRAEDVTAPGSGRTGIVDPFLVSQSAKGLLMAGGKYKLGYLPELDGMRGLAILTVLLYHIGELCGIPSFVEGGHLGVDMFFVLSGFLITVILLQEFDSTGRVELKNFYFRRVLRLGPALLGLLLPLALFCFAFLDRFWSRYNFIDSIITLFYFSNWARAFRIHSPAFLGHTWSLSIEEQFYILWPVTLLCLAKYIRNRWLVACCAFGISISAVALRILLTLTGSSMERLYNGLDTRADSLLIGCTLGIIVSSNLLSEACISRLSKLLRYLSPVSLSIIVAIMLTMSWKSFHLYYWGFISIAVLTAVLILDLTVCRDSSLIRPIFSLRWLVWTGKLSYGLYLWHYPVYKVMMIMNFSRFQLITFGTAATFALVTASYYLLEQPVLRLKKRFGGIRAPSGEPLVEARSNSHR